MTESRPDPQGGASWTPRPDVLRVAFTGHRDLGGVTPDALREAVALGLRRIDAALPDSHSIEFVCGLAQGADQVAADAALAEGAVLRPVSPFSWSEFARDMQGDSEGLARLEDLLERARTGQGRAVDLELNPLLVRAGEGAAELHRSGQEGYVRLGEFLVGCADLLFAFVDRSRASHGPGGALAVLENAAANGVPCWVLTPEGSALSFELLGGYGVERLEEAARHAVRRQDSP